MMDPQHFETALQQMMTVRDDLKAQIEIIKNGREGNAEDGTRYIEAIVRGMDRYIAEARQKQAADLAMTTPAPTEQVPDQELLSKTLVKRPQGLIPADLKMIATPDAPVARTPAPGTPHPPHGSHEIPEGKQK